MEVRLSMEQIAEILIKDGMLREIREGEGDGWAIDESWWAEPDIPDSMDRWEGDYDPEYPSEHAMGHKVLPPARHPQDAPDATGYFFLGFGTDNRSKWLKTRKIKAAGPPPPYGAAGAALKGEIG